MQYEDDLLDDMLRQRAQRQPHPQQPQPTTVRTEPKRRQSPSSQWDIGVAPLERERLDTIAPLVRVIGGFFFLAWSWVSTTFIIGLLLLPIIHGGYNGFGYSYLVGFAVSILVTVGEWVTEGEYPIIHWGIILLLDASFTTYQTHEWLATIVAARDIPYTRNLDLVLWISSAVGGIIAAKFGEKLLLRSRGTRHGTTVRGT